MSEINNNMDTIIQPFIDVVKQINELPEESLNEPTLEAIMNMTKATISDEQKRAAIQEILTSFKNLNFSRGEARQNVAVVLNTLTEIADAFDLSSNKRSIVDALFSPLHEIFNESLEQYHSYDVKLPIKLDDGAACPTYAHDTDAAADLYARETITLPAHTTSNMIDSGVHIALPEGWVGLIFPRSSIGAKTGLRLSNSAGIIDSSYRGSLGIIYDNISDSDYTINAGDRIAQLMVMPSYRFRATVVDQLDETDRNDGGFGSTGK